MTRTPTILPGEPHPPKVKRACIEAWHGKDGWRWRLKAANGEIVCQSESYTRKASIGPAVAALTTAAIDPAFKWTKR